MIIPRNHYLTLFIVLLTGCVSIPTPKQRQDTAEQLASHQGWHKKKVIALGFDLLIFKPIKWEQSSILTVYFEGDGYAWRSKSRLSADPTPINPTALKLAINHPLGNVAYVARPCQYVGGETARGCDKRYWSNRRFSEEVIASSNVALDSLKHFFSATQLQLVGFSGGAAIATILAAQRNDVIKLITVSGNLDHQSWTDFHKLSPLTGSLNPVSYREKLAGIEQIHFVGEHDKVMPAFLAYKFVAGLPVKANAKVAVVSGQSHNCCWESIWKANQWGQVSIFQLTNESEQCF